jgi:hypothetical protein
LTNDVIELSQVIEGDFEPLELESELVEPEGSEAGEPEEPEPVAEPAGDVPEKEQIETRKKKMSVNELIELAVDRGLSREECQKLKKKELLELLR